MPSEPAAVCAAGWGCGRLACPGDQFAGLRVDVGIEGLDGDLVAEAFQVAGAAADAGLLLVVVGPEVLVAGSGAGQQGVVDAHLGVAGGDACLGLASLAGDPPVAGALAGVCLADRDGGLAGDGSEVPVAALVPGGPGTLAGLLVQRDTTAGGGNLLPSTIPASPAAACALFGGRPGTLRGQAAGRDLCRGAARSAAPRGGPAGRRCRSPVADDLALTPRVALIWLDRDLAGAVSDSGATTWSAGSPWHRGT
jgi:hypothetical protein